MTSDLMVICLIIAAAADKNLHLKVISTSQTSAQISFFRESTTSPGTLKGIA